MHILRYLNLHQKLVFQSRIAWTVVLSSHFLPFLGLSVTSRYPVSTRWRWCCQFHQKCKQQKSLQRWGGYGKIKCTTVFLSQFYFAGIRIVTTSRFPSLFWKGTKAGSYRQPCGERWENNHRYINTQIQAQTGCGTCILSAEAGPGAKADWEVLKVQYVSAPHLIRGVIKNACTGQLQRVHLGLTREGQKTEFSF